MSVLACDVGGTRIKLGIVTRGRLRASDTLAAAPQTGLAQALPRIKYVLLGLCERTGIKPTACQGIGMGLPALVNNTQGKVIDQYAKYVDAPELDLNAWARGELGLPLAVDNDARVALLGEWAYGAGRGSSNLAIITLGTGVGTAVMLEGRLLRGPHFQAGNLCGHMIVQEEGRSCLCCGGRGCVEAETGSAQLADRARQMRGYTDSALAQCEGVDYAAVCRCAAQCDPVASALLNRATTLWGVLCVNMIHAFDLDRIVIGGGLMASAQAILPLIRDYVKRHANTPWGKVQIVPAEHPDHMALLGCEPLIQEHLSRQNHEPKAQLR